MMKGSQSSLYRFQESFSTSLYVRGTNDIQRAGWIEFINYYITGKNIFIEEIKTDEINSSYYAFIKLVSIENK